MIRTVQTLRYLSKGYVMMTCIGFFSILFSSAFFNLIHYLNERNNLVQPVEVITLPFEVTASVFSVVIGLLLLFIMLKVVVANGVSRKTFLLANIPAALATAAAFSIFNLVVYLVHQLFRPAAFISQELFPQISLLGVVILQITTYFFLIAAGWLVAMAYARGSTLSRWILSLAPLLLYAILQVADARSNGAVFAAIEAYQRASMGSPMRSIITLVVYSVILVGLVYLLIRRMPIRD